MRYSEQAKAEPRRYAPNLTSAQFFAELARDCAAELGEGALLLVGASDARALSVRRAQAALRYDLRTSYFSHVALITRWDPHAPARSSGLEVALDPEDSALQVPERNAVTHFTLQRYLDDARYPNLALIGVQLREQTLLDAAGAQVKESARARKRALLDAACTPNRLRERYPLWEGLGAWSHYGYSAQLSNNPLLESVPLPAAAYCEYVYASVGVELAPGAVANNICPELIWATFLRWQQSLATSVASCQVHVLVRDEHGVGRPALSPSLEL